MSSRANHFKLGLFVITGLVAGLAALVFLGANRLVHEPTLIETYLDQSVQGLDVGSKVKYRGVTIGSVHANGRLVAPRAIVAARASSMMCP